jgi:ATP-dependent RNA helicase SUPV3L1/SUV3
LKPAVQVLSDERLEAPDRIKVEARLRAWLAAHIQNILRPLMGAAMAEVPGHVRGIVFHLTEHSGAVPRAAVEAQLAALGKPDRGALARLGIRFGCEYVFMPALVKAAAIRLRGLLWIAAHRARIQDTPPLLPPEGRVTFPVAGGMNVDLLAACGYRAIAGHAYRVDILERFAAIARKLAREKVRVLPPEHLSLLGVSAEGAVPVLKALGFRAKVEEAGLTFAARRRHRDGKKPEPSPTPVREDSPFAKLRALIAN